MRHSGEIRSVSPQELVQELANAQELCLFPSEEQNGSSGTTTKKNTS